ncbi:unnamed protein product [Rhizoctonia solani]|uniref:Uncharacterized protein n=1 Tax=Rhizoctonia solani TaxID=456999 RepID=A0A8H3B999_9AGAM|nr:unnamed protein product [Rhizoctonia solani]
MSTNTQTTPKINTSKGSRRQSFLAAAGLVAKSLTEIVDLPGLREPSRAARDIVVALKAPKKNDEKTQELKDRIDEILAKIKPLASGGEHDMPAKSDPELHIVIGKLDRIKAELIKIESRSYATRLARQQDIEQFLNEKERELHIVIQDLSCRPDSY